MSNDNHYDNDEVEDATFDLREFLLELSEKGEIYKQQSYIKKASVKNLEKVFEKYKMKQAKDTNDMICDMLISKAGDILETIGWIKSGAETIRKLQRKKLFMRDFTNLMAHVTPYIPFLGFVEGGISVGEDMANHAVNNVYFPKPGAEKSEEVKNEEE